MGRGLTINGHTRSGWEKVLSAGKKEKTAESITEPSAGRAIKDWVEFSKEWPGMNSTGGIMKVIDRLKEQYPSIHVEIDNKERNGQLSGLASELGTGTHLVISQSFLERMGSSTEEFGRCSSVLAGIAKQLFCQTADCQASGAYVDQSGAEFWTVGNRQEEGREKQKSLSGFSGLSDMISEKNTISSKLMSRSTVISVSRHYSRLAGARNKGQVRTVMEDVQRSISSLQMTAAFGDDEEKVKASRALKSLRKLLARGSRKISRLNKEELATLKKKRAEKKQAVKQAEQARIEIKKKRASRSGSDHRLVLEGLADEAYIRGYRHYRQLNDSQEGIQMPGFLPADGTAGAAEISIPAADGDIKTADVTVSGTISF